MLTLQNLAAIIPPFVSERLYRIHTKDKTPEIKLVSIFGSFYFLILK